MRRLIQLIQLVHLIRLIHLIDLTSLLIHLIRRIILPLHFHLITLPLIPIRFRK